MSKPEISNVPHGAGSPDEATFIDDPYQRTLLGRIDRRTLSRPIFHWAFAIAIGAILIVPSVQFVRRIGQVEPSVYRADKHRTALGRWLPDAEALTKLDEGANPYGEGHWFPTPPFVLMCLIPFWKMGYTAAGVAWAALKIAGLTVSLWLLVRSLGPPHRSVPIGVLVMAAVFGARPVVSDLQHGNLNIFVMVWIALAWALYVRGRDVAAGVLLALAIVTKITPALLLVYFVYKRQWRVVIGAAIGLVMFFALFPSLYLGLDRNLDLLHAWYRMLVEPFALHGFGTLDIPNQSLYGVALRLLSNAGVLSVEFMSQEMALRAGMEPEIMARPVTTVGRLLRPAIGLLVLIPLAWSCRRTRGPATVSRRDVRCWLELSLVLLAMLLLSERTWKHHGTTLPIVFLSVWYALTCEPWSDRFRAWFVAGLTIQWLLLVATSEGFLGDHLAELCLDGGVFCWGLVLCFIQTCVLLAGLKRKAAAETGG